MKGVQVCSNEGSRPLKRGDNFELSKFNCKFQKFSKTILLETYVEAFSGNVYSFVQIIISGGRVGPQRKGSGGCQIYLHRICRDNI